MTMTFRQMVDMDVYFLPAFFLGVPLLALGAVQIIRHLKHWMLPILIVPIILIIADRWNRIDISDKPAATQFLEYLTTKIPEGTTVFPVSDEVAFPLLYNILALDNHDAYHLPRDSRTIVRDALHSPEDNASVTLIEIDDVFLDAFVAKGDHRLAGPFIISPRDSILAGDLESAFISTFAFENFKSEDLNRLDRMSLARIWARRGVYWFYVYRKRAALNLNTGNAFDASIKCFQQATRYDDFSLEGAQHAANLAFAHIRGKQYERAYRAIAAGLKLNRQAPEVHRAAYTIAMTTTQYPTALSALQTLVRLSPRDAELRINMAALHAMLNQREEATRAYIKGLSLGATPREELEAYLDIPDKPQGQSIE
jgi:tetratricopeptide (TPR) repeat protein